jgi:hypothetical protein
METVDRPPEKLTEEEFRAKYGGRAESIACTNLDSATNPLMPVATVDRFTFGSFSGQPQYVSASANGNQLHFHAVGLHIGSPLRGVVARLEILTYAGATINVVGIDASKGPVITRQVPGDPQGAKVVVLQVSNDDRIDFIVLSGGGDEASLDCICVLGEPK